MKSYMNEGTGYIFSKNEELVYDTEKHEIYQLYRDADIGFITNKVVYSCLVPDLDKHIKEMQDLAYEMGVQKPYSLWKDGRLYYVHCIAHNVEDNKKYVIYQAMYGGHKYYARPYNIFTEKVDTKRIEENKTGQEYRFEIVR